MTFIFNIIYFFIMLGLFFWLAVVVGGLLMSWWLKWRMRQLRRRFSDAAGESSDPFGSNRSNGGSRSTRRSTRSGSITVEDRRSPDVAQQKIFSDDEGEYVDFKEV